MGETGDKPLRGTRIPHFSHGGLGRIVEVPADIDRALKAAGVPADVDALSYSRFKEHVHAIEDAKKPETRDRRIRAAVSGLNG